MVGGIIAILIAIWFYMTAVRIGAPDPFKWVIHAVLMYFLVVFLWWWFANLPSMEPYHHKNLAAGLFFAYFGNLLGLAVVALIRWRLVKEFQR